MTSWRPATPGDPAVSARPRRRDLDAAGFGVVVVETRPAWLSAERQVWEEVAAIGDDEPDEAQRSPRDEGRRSLETFDALPRGGPARLATSGRRLR